MSRRIAKSTAPAATAGLVKLIGQKVLLLCANYFYAGTLRAVDAETAELEGAQIVYETGAWDAAQYATAEKLPGHLWSVRVESIESYGIGK